MTRPKEDGRWRTAALIVVCAGATAAAACRARPAAPETSSAPEQPGSTVTEERTATPGGMHESSATFEVLIATPAIPPRAAAERVPAEEMPVAEARPADDPTRCLTLEATPNSISAYGARGPAVQLVVRARNGCASAFSGPATYFRAIAVSLAGYELASATGRFSGLIPPYGSAETLIAIETDPTRVRTWRVELR